MNLYPYNYWILYASIALLVIVLIKSLLDIAKAAKEAAAAVKPLTDDLNRNAALMKIKTDAINEKKQENAKKNKYLKLALPIVLGVYRQYRKDETATGPKGVVKSAQIYYANDKAQKELIKKVKEAL